MHENVPACTCSNSYCSDTAQTNFLPIGAFGLGLGLGLLPWALSRPYSGYGYPPYYGRGYGGYGPGRGYYGPGPYYGPRRGW